MGAQVFSSTASGKDAKEAFTNAVQQAQYDYGHAGYSGTIAEKDSYVIVSDKPLNYPDAEGLASQMIEDCDPRIDDKWGPAGAIPLIDGDFLFFGWASS